VPSRLTKHADPQHLSVSLQAAFALAPGSELKTSNMTQMDTEMYLEREEIVKQHICIEELM